MKTAPNLQDADTFYWQLPGAHQGLSLAQSELLHARLVLLLANRIGDACGLADCVVAARRFPTLGAADAPGSGLQKSVLQ